MHLHHNVYSRLRLLNLNSTALLVLIPTDQTLAKTIKHPELINDTKERKKKAVKRCLPTKNSKRALLAKV
jgi:hypothetical protein